ncbi:MAG TPA: Clp1/GlmU family protein [Nitrososphaeraceae archaeon]|nr:Clp1/GlmU family protein [Nitrososphaeraceae archaeon]
MKLVLLVKGPAIVCVEGKGWILGKDASNSRVSVNVGKILPVEKDPDCKINCIGGESWLASYSVAGTSIWEDIVHRILHDIRTLGTVLVVGNTDTGKSTFAAYLINGALKIGLRPTIIDADIGQGDLAPPNTIGGAIINTQVIDLRDIAPSLIEFVGSITPAGFEDPIIEAVKKILRGVRISSNICIINTDGYVLNDGINYKIRMAEEIKPDVIVCLGEYTIFQIFRRNFLSSLVLYGKSPINTLKSKIDRKQRRLSQFSRYISGNDKSYAIRIRQAEFVYKGKTFHKSQLRYGILHLMNRNNTVHIQQKKLVRMFVGLGLANRIVGFGIIVDVFRHRLYIKSCVSKFDQIYLSNSAIIGDNPSEFKIIN